MEKLFKRIAFTFALTMFFIALNPFAVEAGGKENQKTIMRAWPGRPEGNGDGSEEWLQGNYGEPNGPFKTLYTSQGRVSDLNTEQSVVDAIGLGIVDALSGGVFKGTEALITSNAVTAMGIAKTIKGNYEGNYYRSITYISGRCMKTVMTTYEDRDCTEYVTTYEKWTKW